MLRSPEISGPESNYTMSNCLDSNIAFRHPEHCFLSFYIDWLVLMCFLSGYSSEMFLAIQDSVSRGIIRQKTSKAYNTKVHMQRLPQVSFREDPLLIVLERFITIIIMLSFSYTFVNTVRVITIEKELQLKVNNILKSLINLLIVLLLSRSHFCTYNYITCIILWVSGNFYFSNYFYAN